MSRSGAPSGGGQHCGLRLWVADTGLWSECAQGTVSNKCSLQVTLTCYTHRETHTPTLSHRKHTQTHTHTHRHTHTHTHRHTHTHTHTAYVHLHAHAPTPACPPGLPACLPVCQAAARLPARLPAACPPTRAGARKQARSHARTRASTQMCTLPGHMLATSAQARTHTHTQRAQPAHTQTGTQHHHGPWTIASTTSQPPRPPHSTRGTVPFCLLPTPSPETSGRQRLAAPSLRDVAANRGHERFRERNLPPGTLGAWARARRPPPRWGRPGAAPRLAALAGVAGATTRVKRPPSHRAAPRRLSADLQERSQMHTRMMRLQKGHEGTLKANAAPGLWAPPVAHWTASEPCRGHSGRAFEQHRNTAPAGGHTHTHTRPCNTEREGRWEQCCEPSLVALAEVVHTAFAQDADVDATPAAAPGRRGLQVEVALALVLSLAPLCLNNAGQTLHSLLPCVWRPADQLLLMHSSCCVCSDWGDHAAQSG